MPKTSNRDGGGGGDVIGPGSSTDNAVVRWNGAAGTDIQNSGVIISDTNDVTIPGMTAVGNSAQFGVVSGVMRYIDQAWTVQDFTAVSSWRIDSARFIVDPNADFATDTATARFSQISIPNTNANDFGALIANNAIADHSGGGVLGTNIGAQSTARLFGGGTITTNVGQNVNVTGASGGTGVITNNYGIVVTSGVSNAAGTSTNDYQIVLRSPDQTGTVTNIRGIFAENHAGSGSGYFIYSEGGRSYHSGNLGIGSGNTAPASTLDVLGTCLFTIPDDSSSVFNITQGANNYFSVNTNNGTETILFGNAVTSPSYVFQGSGTAEFDCILQPNGTFAHAGTNFAALGATPTTQQVGGAQTAAAAYGATEQDMLQKAYNALRTFGFLS